MNAEIETLAIDYLSRSFLDNYNLTHKNDFEFQKALLKAMIRLSTKSYVNFDVSYISWSISKRIRALLIDNKFEVRYCNFVANNKNIVRLTIGWTYQTLLDF